MSIPLRVLILEDRPVDAELLLRELRQAGFDPEWQQVETEEEYLVALHSSLDIILSDYSLPQFDGLSALRLLRTRGFDIPFILISGTIGEEVAVECIKQGAADYLLKDRLTRLGSAVTNALEQKRLRDERKQAEETLRASEKRFRTLIENGLDDISLLTADGTLIWESPSVIRNLAYAPNEFLGRNIFELMHPDDLEQNQNLYAELIQKPASRQSGTFRLRHSDGTWRWVEAIASNMLNEPSVQAIVINYRDITERKQAEEALRASKLIIEGIINAIPVRVFWKDKNLVYLGCNVVFAHDKGFTDPKEVIGKDDYQMAPRDQAELYRDDDRQVIESGRSKLFIEEPQTTPEGNIITLLTSKVPLRSSKGEIIGVIGTYMDITERKQAEEQTQRQLQRLAALRAIDQAIAGSMDVNFVFKVILDRVISQLAVDAAVILLYNPAAQALEYSTGRGFRTEALQHTRLPLGEGYAGRAAQARQMVHIPDLQGRKTDFLRSPTFSQEGFVSYFGVPLIAKGEIKGVLEVFHRAAFEAEAEWLNFLEMLAGQTAIATDNAALFKGLQLSNIELTMAYDATIEGWSRALDLRDKETEGHTQRVTEMSQRLARAMRIKEAELINMRRGALLHDIGKMGVPDSILLKPGELTDEEWVVMRQHPQFAFDMLSPIAYLHSALDIPYCHHEKWDGSGYPRGLKGEEIPLAARIFAVVDVWDALNSDRPYRPAWPEEKVREYVREQAGKHFDPQVVEAFFQMIGENNPAQGGGGT
ncbi:MAG: PAS domain S-box protein [Chloroflexi bacterium]|nr:PAS domain S-box protein [Chloroflexota bacterium]